MTTALLLVTEGPQTPPLAADLASLGIHVLGASDGVNLVREVARQVPDVLVCWTPSPDAALLAALAALRDTAPLPVALFTLDADVTLMEGALDSGVHAYVVSGYGLARLRPTLHLAQLRFRRESRLRREMQELGERFEERKLVDRAKGILMRATQVSEDEAFRVLRTASMHVNQRVGQVSRQIIDAAHHAESVNRAGQLRMLSQRLVKLHALRCANADEAGATRLLAQSVQRAEQTLAHLERSLSRPTFGDLVDAVKGTWRELKAELDAEPRRVRLRELDEHAERLMTQAEQLTLSLETAGSTPPLHVINVCGRQRMLSQRLAKQALLTTLLPRDVAAAIAEAAAETQARFEQAMTHLAGIPLSSAEIREGQELALQEWRRLLDGVQRVHGPAGRLLLAEASEALLEQLDRLTERYERSMQTLIG
ncbi:type IV pili methyl-accepting chemotaxis transducer N-terminal domain-containing protein [Caldimonas tepidiphila]|uniref:type IV pili methyl-accepting chemotaxis transducer N-terminal domain-containing protein n=1 Tax=Caldimonas tepidiphila TaxID=2315841 RepID=UPI000E5A4420|nr:type IV pili methyl-accepting chemotaxis transducer N-terminal domain-containing protein [Caldimonas tepidiphila]